MAALVPVLRAADGTATTHIQSARISQLVRADEVDGGLSRWREIEAFQLKVSIGGAVAAQGASGRPSCRFFAYATPAAASIASTIDGSSFPGLGHQLIGIGGDDCKSPNPFA